MASPFNAVVCALIASALWGLIGYAIGRHVLPRVLALSAAPVLGWAAHSAVSLPIISWIGFSPTIVGTIGMLFLIIASLSLLRPVTVSKNKTTLSFPPWAFGIAAILALVPAVAILPKFSGDAVYVADPIFDHAKSAI